MCAKSRATLIGLLFAYFCATYCEGVLAEERQGGNLPVPDNAALQESRKLVKELYGIDYANAKTAAQKLDLARKLLKVAVESKGDHSFRFVLLCVVRDLGVEAGSLDVSVQAIDTLAAGFQIDPLTVKVQVAGKVASHIDDREALQSYVATLSGIVEQAISLDRYEDAKQLTQLAQEAASKAKSRQIVAETSTVQQEVELLLSEYETVKAAATVLTTNPDDADANTRVGKFRCFVKNDWKSGIPMLAQGSDEALKKLARSELAQPQEDSEVLLIGDGWWDIAQGHSAKTRMNIYGHAALWYSRVASRLEGLSKAKVEKRLAAAPADHRAVAFGAGPYGNRTVSGRRKMTESAGGSVGSEAAVESALAWLAEHQNANGSWSFPYTPGGRCNGFANPGSAQTYMGATGLALLPFLGAGYTYRNGPDGENNKYRNTVRRGVNYLIANMKIMADGGRLFDPGGNGQFHMYSHGIAACALVEAYGMTQDKQLKKPAQLALNYIYAAQHLENGGWLYEPKQGGDTSVVGWQVMAIKSGVLSNLSVTEQVRPMAAGWLDSVSWDNGASYGYRMPNDRPPNDACTAIGLLCRNYLGWKKDHPGLVVGVKQLHDRGPSERNMYYNYYGSMVMFQNDGPAGNMWRDWNEVMKAHLLETQVKAGNDKGSWYFDGGHGEFGGRVYNTAMAAMTLEVYYRYPLIYLPVEP